MLKFYHFVIDQKFIPLSKKCFDNAGLTENRFIYVKRNEEPLHFVNGIVDVLELEEAKSILVNSNSCDVVILHCLYCLPFQLIASIHPKLKVVWYGWGYDIYSIIKPGFPLIRIDPFMSETKQFISLNNNSLYSRLMSSCREIKRNYKFLFVKSYFKEAIKRIDYFAGVFPIERDLIAKENPFFKAKKVTHNYINYDEFDVCPQNVKSRKHTNSILINNSANIEGNHLDVINQIVSKKILLDDYKVIAPLSYSGTADYVNNIVESGVKFFGKSFCPLLSYIPLAEYTELITTCKVAFFGYIRQAATCNILTCLWNGTKVVLPTNSINFHFYKSIGMVVYSFDDISDDFLKLPESTDNIVRNRTLIHNLYSFDAWKRDLRDCLSIISPRGNL